MSFAALSTLPQRGSCGMPVLATMWSLPPARPRNDADHAKLCRTRDKMTMMRLIYTTQVPHVARLRPL